MLGGIHTSIMTSVNVLLDLLSSPSRESFYTTLRQEADIVFAKSEDWGNQASPPKLVHTDSAIRESLRRSPVITKNLLREVISKDGLEMPNGQKIPQGVWVAVPTIRIHYDDRLFPDAESYKPFRFVPDMVKDLTEQEASIGSKRLEDQDPTALRQQRKHQGLSTASETFLGFGYGRHSWYVPHT